MRVEASTYRSYGDDCLRQGDYRLAIAQYQQALKIEPDRVNVLCNLARAWIKAGDSATGAGILNDALQTETSRSAREFIHFNLGELAEAQGASDDAIEHYRRAIGFSVERALVHCKLGSLYLKNGQYEEARAAFEEALASQLDVCLPYRTMLQTNLDALESEASHLATIDKDISPEILLEAIRKQLSEEIDSSHLARYDLETIRQAQQNDPVTADIHNHLGLAYSRLGDLEKAVKHVEKALEILPESEGARKNLEALQMQRSQQNAPVVP